LERGLGVVEGYRTKELLSRFLRPSMDICDIGGGTGKDFIDDPEYMEMLRTELTTGNHNKPGNYNVLCDAYFHTPEEFRAELAEAGFAVDSLYAIEGCAWLTPALEGKWQQESCRENLLALVRLTEEEPSLLGLSPHFLAVSKRD